MQSTKSDARIAEVVRGTIAYAAGMSESALAEDTRLHELGVDSVAMLAAGAVLQAELEISINPDDIVRIFMAETVAEAIAITSKVYGDFHA